MNKKDYIGDCPHWLIGGPCPSCKEKAIKKEVKAEQCLKAKKEKDVEFDPYEDFLNNEDDMDDFDIYNGVF